MEARALLQTYTQISIIWYGIQPNEIKYPRTNNLICLHDSIRVTELQICTPDVTGCPQVSDTDHPGTERLKLNLDCFIVHQIIYIIKIQRVMKTYKINLVYCYQLTNI